MEESALLSSESEKTSITGGCLVQRTLLQHGVKVSRKAIVKESFLMEYSSVDQEGKVRQQRLKDRIFSHHALPP